MPLFMRDCYWVGPALAPRLPVQVAHDLGRPMGSWNASPGLPPPKDPRATSRQTARAQWLLRPYRAPRQPD
jgi:hypothetical protein